MTKNRKRSKDRKKEGKEERKKETDSISQNASVIHGDGGSVSCCSETVFRACSVGVYLCVRAASLAPVKLIVTSQKSDNKHVSDGFRLCYWETATYCLFLLNWGMKSKKQKSAKAASNKRKGKCNVANVANVVLLTGSSFNQLSLAWEHIRTLWNFTYINYVISHYSAPYWHFRFDKMTHNNI